MLEHLFLLALVDLVILLREDELGGVFHEIQASLLQIVTEIKVYLFVKTFYWICVLDNYRDYEGF